MSESPQQRASLLAPMPGDVIAQADIPDPAFAGGAMGVGFGVVPEENTVVAPVSGRITMVADTGHALIFSNRGHWNFLWPLSCAALVAAVVQR